jgi:hypothetical protein
VKKLATFGYVVDVFPGKCKLIFREIKIGQPTKIKSFHCLTNHWTEGVGDIALEGKG